MTNGCRIYFRESQIDGFVDDPSNLIELEPAPSCPADLSGDEFVNAVDIAMLLQAWGGVEGDPTGDGVTNAADITVLLQAWLQLTAPQPFPPQTPLQQLLVDARHAALPEPLPLPPTAPPPPRPLLARGGPWPRLAPRPTR